MFPFIIRLLFLISNLIVFCAEPPLLRGATYVQIFTVTSFCWLIAQNSLIWLFPLVPFKYFLYLYTALQKIQSGSHLLMMCWHAFGSHLVKYADFSILLWKKIKTWQTRFICLFPPHSRQRLHRFLPECYISKATVWCHPPSGGSINRTAQCAHLLLTGSAVCYASSLLQAVKMTSGQTWSQAAKKQDWVFQALQGWTQRDVNCILWPFHSFFWQKKK